MNNQTNVVIIGGGAAAVSAAKALRAGDPELKIDIYTKESIPPYFRPSLTFGVMSTPPEPRLISKPEFYVSSNIGLHLNMNAIAIDREAKTVTFADDSKVSYTYLLIATGTHRVIPKIPSVKLPEVISLCDHRDLKALLELLKVRRNIVVIGTGVLGLELASVLLQVKHHVTVVGASGLLKNQLNAAGRAFYEEIIKKVPDFEVVTGSAVKEICGAGRVEGVNLIDGRHLECDLVIISAGATSNVDLAQQCGLEYDKGIAIDNQMRTSDPAIFAAGDCAEVACQTFGLWEPALAQGKVAASAILGKPEIFHCKCYGGFLNAFGTKLYSIGFVDGDDSVEMRDDANKNYSQIFFGGDSVVGGFMIGDTNKMMALTKAVNEQYTKAQAKEQGLF